MKQRDDDKAEGPIAGLAALREVTPPASLVPAVMRQVAEPRPVSLWFWLRRPRRFEVRLSPLSLASCFALGTFALVSVSGRLPLAPTPQAPPVLGEAMRPLVVSTSEADAERVVMVRFVLVAKGAKKVAIAGDFNGWNPEQVVLEDADGHGTFVATVPLPRGAHEYMFVVDGEWVTDPSAPELKPDGFGRQNAVLRL
jgi:hypothetical protein